MNVFLRTSHCRAGQALSFVSLRSGASHARLAYSAITRFSPYSTEAGATVSQRKSHVLEGNVPRVPYGFRELGIQDALVIAMQKAFPGVRRPTIAQADFIPAILNGKDVLLHDETGTGKSFGSIVALLNKPRTKCSHGRHQSGARITSLIIVPHRDLGYQMMHWVKSILEHREQYHQTMDSVAQLIARGDSSLDDQIRKLELTPPHILIGTPQALWQIYSTARNVLQLESLATAVLDEVDYLLDIPPLYVRKSRESTVWKNFKKHPSLTRQLLEAVLPERKPGAVPLADIDYNDDSNADIRTKGRKERGTTRAPHLQLVMSSATVHSNLTNFLCDAGWLGTNRAILSGWQLLKLNEHMLKGHNKPKHVVHHAFVVRSDGRFENVDFAVKPGEDNEIEDHEKEEERDAGPTDFREKLRRMQGGPPHSPTSPYVLEAIATVFAFDVPRLALLVIPPGSSVQKVVAELQDLGVAAGPLDLRSRHAEVESNEEDAEPTLFVATPSTIRGVDLPQLTHVFVAGAPDTASADVFKHASGRVGRFGREGKVLTFVTERETERRDGVVRTTKNPVGLLKSFYRNLRIKPEYYSMDEIDNIE